MLGRMSYMPVEFIFITIYKINGRNDIHVTQLHSMYILRYGATIMTQ